MELVELHQPLAQLEIALQRRQARVGLLDQGMIDRRGDGVGRQGSFQRAGIMAGLGLEDLRLDMRRQ